MPHLKFCNVGYPEPHRERARAILKAHPEIRQLFGRAPVTALFVFLLVGAQVAISWWLRDSSWIIILAVAYLVGAFVCHALWTLIHECTHNLVFRGNRSNSWLQIVAGMPHIFPSAMSFRKYHLLHHKHQGDLDYDADLAAPFEVRFAGRSPLRKALWLLFYFAFQSARAFRLKRVSPVDRWVVLNFIIQSMFIGLILFFLGAKAFSYLLISSIFSIGLHPVGARWIQEHFLLRPPQETYSYYGPLNYLSFFVGYHNEHHDFVSVPWTRLSRVRATAPEFYDSLYHHTSWTRLLLRFIFDPHLHLCSRIVRAQEVKSEPKIPALVIPKNHDHSLDVTLTAIN